jgi:selenocysteine lyase/cysteine desulfurase
VDVEAFRSMLDGTYPAPFGDDDAAGADGEGGAMLEPASIRMVCVTNVPTNSGIVNPVCEIGAAIEGFNSRHRGNKQKLPRILYLVDACQSLGQLDVDVRRMGCHALAATGRKYLRGPRGTGFLYVRRGVAEMLEPSHVDHAAAPVLDAVAMMRSSGSSASSSRGAPPRGLEEEGGDFGLRHGYGRGARRFEFWESSAANRLGLGAAIDAALGVGTGVIEDRCAMLGRMLRDRLGTLGGRV